jgi:hypothetical protein
MKTMILFAVAASAALFSSCGDDDDDIIADCHDTVAHMAKCNFDFSASGTTASEADNACEGGIFDDEDYCLFLCTATDADCPILSLCWHACIQ